MLITKPGCYKITQNHVVSSEEAAITISSDNVTLNLCNYKIIGKNTRIGIRIIKGNNVVIKNGTVDGFNFSGIYSNDVGSNSRISNVVVENINRTGHDLSGGIFLSSPRNPLNIKIEGCSVQNCQGDVGFYGIGVITEGGTANLDDVSLLSSTVDRGIYIEKTYGNVLYCVLRDNTFFKGLWKSDYVRDPIHPPPQIAEPSIIANCQVVGNRLGPIPGSINDFYHCIFSQYEGDTIKDCIVSNNTCEFRLHCIGLNANSGVIQGCRVTNNQADIELYGIIPSSYKNAILVEDCFVASNWYLTQPQCTFAGFIFDGTFSSVILRRCTVSNNRFINSSSYTSRGVNVKTLAAVLEDCISSNNDNGVAYNVSYFNGALVKNCSALNEKVGFYSNTENKVTVMNCQVLYCETPFDVTPSVVQINNVVV